MKLAYSGADADLARSRPETRALVARIATAFPGLRLGSSIRPNDPYPDHRDGAAVDLMTSAEPEHQRVCAWLIAEHNAGRIRVRSIISWRRRWTPSTGWATYRGTLPHTDHVHVWLDLSIPAVAYPLTGITRGGKPAYYGNRRGPANWVGGYHSADRPAIRRIQAILRAAGLDLGTSGIDGIYGDRTTNAVRAWQARHKLPADGLVGPSTWAAMMR